MSVDDDVVFTSPAWNLRGRSRAGLPPWARRYRLEWSWRFARHAVVIGCPACSRGIAVVVTWTRDLYAAIVAAQWAAVDRGECWRCQVAREDAEHEAPAVGQLVLRFTS